MFFKKNAAPKPEIDIVPEIEAEAEKPQLKFVPSTKTVIGSGIEFEGDFETTDPIELNGLLTGNINSSTVFSVGQSGSYKGTAKVNTLVVDGTVDASVQCDDLARLSITSVVSGELNAKRLIAEDGASFDGSLKLVPVKVAAPEPAPEEPEEPEEEEPASEEFSVAEVDDAEQLFAELTEDQPV